MRGWLFNGLVRLYCWLQVRAMASDLRLNFRWPGFAITRCPRWLEVTIAGLFVFAALGFAITVGDEVLHPRLTHPAWYVAVTVHFVLYNASRDGAKRFWKRRYSTTGMRARTVRHFKRLRNDRWSGYQPHHRTISAIELIRRGPSDRKTQASSSQE